jgi:class 3 adenylate cyclase
VPDVDRRAADGLARRDVDHGRPEVERHAGLPLPDVASQLVAVERERAGRHLRREHAGHETGGDGFGTGAGLVAEQRARAERSRRKAAEPEQGLAPSEAVVVHGVEAARSAWEPPGNFARIARVSRPDLPSGTVTFLFTDVEGSTRLLQEHGAGYADLLAAHRTALREAFSAHGGVEVDTQGDAFFVAFARAADAVAAAAAGRAALEEGPVRVRMGVHTGEPLVTDEGYVGLDVHRAARIAAAAHGGQVVVSETTRQLCDADVVLRDLGKHRLKDLTGAQHLYQLGPGDFPPLRTLDATNLPIAASPLVGRQRELDELVAMLSNGTRLLTLTGPGGTGKTRLALQAGAELVGRLRDGVFWVPLAGLSDPELIASEIAQAVGARDDFDAFIRDKQLLILLDNFEHLLAAAPAVSAALATARGLRVLVTSRAPLHVSGEREYRVEPLPTGMRRPCSRNAPARSAGS